MELKDAILEIDIVDYIGQYIFLQQQGDEWWGLSPFKEENTPSFSVRRDPAFFYDYSSGESGNLFHFVKKYHNFTNREAAKHIFEYAGYSAEEIKKAEANKMAATKCCQKFAKKKQTKKEVQTTFLPFDCMDVYEMDSPKLSVWENEGISREVLRKFEVAYDGYSNRLVYPIRSVDGHIVNIGGRTLDPLWKEKGQRKYCYFFKWGRMTTIYGLSENRKSILQKKEVIIFEGCKSVLLAKTWGFDNCAALLTSHLSPDQLKILAKLGCRVIFMLDKDVDVRTDKNINRLKQYVNVYRYSDNDDLLGEKDAPVDKGVEVFCRLLDGVVRIR